jgi:hypothetical protein
MKRWLIVFLCAVVAAFLTWGAHARIDQRRRHKIARFQAENDQLRLRISQWYSTIPASAKASLAEPPVAPSVASAPGQVTEAAASPLRKDVEFYDAGRATPTAALETLAWACDSADPKTVEGLVVFDDAARAKTVAFLATLPPKLQAQWPSPEVAAADVLVDGAKERPFPIPRVLALARVEQLGPDRVKLRLPDTNYDDMDFRRLDSGWAYAITEAEVDLFIERNAPRKR